jgi:hypothetical protein
VADEAIHSTRRFVIDDCSPLAGATFRACGAGDVDCGSPAATTILDQAGKGQLTLDVAQGAFYGYFETFGIDGITPEIRHFTSPVFADRHRFNGHYRDTEIDDVHALYELPRLADRGLVLAFPHDCDETPAPGIALSMPDLAGDADVVPFYFDNGIFPTPGLDETQPGDNRGGGFTNVPPGKHTLTATETATGREVARMDVLVRAGWVTIAIVKPSP